MANIITLEDMQIFEIAHIRSNQPYSDKTKMKGKFFDTFRYDGIVFTVPSDNRFVQDFIEGNVKSVKLMKGERTKKVTNEDGTESDTIVPQLTFDTHVSLDQEKRFANHRADLMEIEARGAVAMAKATAVAKLDAAALSTLNALA